MLPCTIFSRRGRREEEKKKTQLRKEMNIKFRTPRSIDPNSQMIALKCTFHSHLWNIILLLKDSNIMYFGKLSLTSLFKMKLKIKIMTTLMMTYLMASI